MAHAEMFGRIAIIGDKQWERWGTEMSNPFFDAQMRFFEPQQKDCAERWLVDAQTNVHPA